MICNIDYYDSTNNQNILNIKSTKSPILLEENDVVRIMLNDFRPKNDTKLMESFSSITNDYNIIIFFIILFILLLTFILNKNKITN